MVTNQPVTGLTEEDHKKAGFAKKKKVSLFVLCGSVIIQLGESKRATCVQVPLKPCVGPAGVQKLKPTTYHPVLGTEIATNIKSNVRGVMRKQEKEEHTDVDVMGRPKGRMVRSGSSSGTFTSELQKHGGGGFNPITGNPTPVKPSGKKLSAEMKEKGGGRLTL